MRDGWPDGENDPSSLKMKSLSRRKLLFLGIVLGALYGVYARLMFGLNHEESGRSGRIFAVMSSSFIFGVPLALGFITVWFGEYREKYGWPRRILMPWVASLACLFTCLLFAWEWTHLRGSLASVGFDSLLCRRYSRRNPPPDFFRVTGRNSNVWRSWPCFHFSWHRWSP